MRAAVCRAFGEPLVIEDVQLAAPARGELRVRLAACAICQSDLHYLEGAWGGSLPAVFGHEAAGVVVEVGARRGGRRRGRPRRRDADPLLRRVRVVRARRAGALRRDVRARRGRAADRCRRPARSPRGSARGPSPRRSSSTRPRRSAIPPELPLDRAALLACGVITGFGAVVNTAGVEPGATRGRDRNRRRGAERRAGRRPCRCGHDRRDRSLRRQARDGPGLRRDARRQLGIRGRRRRRSRAHRRARRRLRHRHGRGRRAPSSRARCCCAGRARW